jgi:hypothetical protein
VKLAASVWSFVAGDSRLAPLAVALAVATAAVLQHVAAGGPVAGIALAGIVALGLAAAVFERV